MTSNRQLGLFPKRGDQLRSTLHGFESVAGKGADLLDVVQAQIGQFPLLHVAADIFNRIQLWRIRGKPLKDHCPSSEST